MAARCFVPFCINGRPSTQANAANADKLFIRVPNNPEMREKWYEAVGIKKKPVPKTSHLFCCEDHFDLENDVENWMFYKTMGSQLRFKDNVVPRINVETNVESQLTLSDRKRKQENLANLQIQNGSDKRLEMSQEENMTMNSVFLEETSIVDCNLEPNSLPTQSPKLEVNNTENSLFFIYVVNDQECDPLMTVKAEQLPEETCEVVSENEANIIKTQSTSDIFVQEKNKVIDLHGPNFLETSNDIKYKEDVSNLKNEEPFNQEESTTEIDAIFVQEKNRLIDQNGPNFLQMSNDIKYLPENEEIIKTETTTEFDSTFVPDNVAIQINEEVIKTESTAETKINSVKYLVNNPFSNLTDFEKLAVKQLKRPTPELTLVQKKVVKGKFMKAEFKNEVYLKNDWICGCNVRNAFFCFPCLLFGDEIHWTKMGIKDIIFLDEKINIHENSEVHIKNELSLALFGKPNIKNLLNAEYRIENEAHNKQVTKNRHTLNLIINCIRLFGDDETKNEDLINFTSELDNVIKKHIEKTQIFKEYSKTIQNDLLDAMLQIYHEEVASEIKSADYVAIIADETSDITNQFTLALVFRYIVNGKPVEKFWKFLKPIYNDVNSLSKCILDEINSLVNDPEKIIAQSYDGGPIMKNCLNGIQKQIREKFPRAIFINRYVHQENLMSKASASNVQCRIFFANFSGLCTFFSLSPARVQMLNEVIQRKKLPKPNTKWHFNSFAVNTVYVYRNELIEVLENIEKSVDTDAQTIIQAGAYIHVLEDENFIFWLTIFYKIMPHVDNLFNLLKTGALKIQDDLENFEKAVIKIQSEITDSNDIILDESELIQPPKRRKISDSEKIKGAIEFCEEILSGVRNKFEYTGHLVASDLSILDVKSKCEFTGHLMASNLFSYDLYPMFAREFPEDYLKETVKCYPFLNQKRLKTELTVLYQTDEFRQNGQKTGAVPLLCLLLNSEFGLSNTFQEVIKLLKIIVTIPMTTSEPERCFLILNKIKTFLKNTKNENQLNVLCVLSCEKDFINEIDNFNTRVIDVFCANSNQMDFQYRQI